MKKMILILLALCLLCGALAGCGAHEARFSASPSVVATVFPVWDWTRNILGDTPDGMRLTLLLDNGVDMHSYQPTVEDMTAISTCDLFIYVGGESDIWVEDALKTAVNEDMTVLNLMDVLGDEAKLEETVEGMQGGEEEETAYDEHIWLSLRNAEACCAAIADALTRVDPDRADAYSANAAAYLERLNALDMAYQAELSAVARNTLVFADRFPFRYLLDDYNLKYYAAFPGCEAETEASFETVMFLAGKVDELGLAAVLTTESPVPRLAKTVVSNTARNDAAVLILDSMQSVTPEAVGYGAAYLPTMEQNLSILKEALR